jgi:hypothetical protein
MKKRYVVAVALAAGLTAATTASAAPSLRSFGTGDVTLEGDSATIVNETGEYGGVYLPSRNLPSSLAGVHMSFVSTGDVAGGAPSIRIPISSDGDATWDFYVTLAVDRSGGAPGERTTVSTESATSIVDINTGGSYPNWDAFVEANPTWRLARNADAFLIADWEGIYQVEDIVLR